MLKLTEHVGITIFLLYKQKILWNSDIQNFYSEILNFHLFYAKKKIVTLVSGIFLWRHNYVTPWPIVLILVCMNGEGLYLATDTKIKTSLFVFRRLSNIVKYLSPPPVSSRLRLFLINVPITRGPIMQSQRLSGNPPLCLHAKLSASNMCAYAQHTWENALLMYAPRENWRANTLATAGFLPFSRK